MMSNDSGRFMFAGHVIGASARFHRLDPLTDLNHVIPTQGQCVLPVTGGRSESKITNPYRYDVTEPRQRCLLHVDSVDTWVEGRDANSKHETELSIELSNLQILEKLYIDSLRFHMLTVRNGSGDPVVTTKGNRIEGMRLTDKVKVQFTIDDEPLCHTGSADQLAAYYQGKGYGLPKYGEHHRCSLVRDIKLIGEEKDKVDMSVGVQEGVDTHIIRWKGFGRIILGEVHVKGHERRLTLVRLNMGSDAGGSGAAGDGQSNGATGTG